MSPGAAGASSFDVIVVGLGAMGSAAALHLARRRRRVLGLERYRPGHDQGSSHGRSRIIRKAYFENPAYVPLLLRAYELWRALERDSGRALLRITGGLMIGPAESEVFDGALASARRHGLAHEVLEAAELSRRFPAIRPEPETLAVWEPDAGVVRPEDSVGAQLELAGRAGAELRFEEPLVAWTASDGREGVEVRTERGSYRAAVLVFAPGAWAPGLLGDFGIRLQVARQVMFWFDPAGGVRPFLPDRFPVYIWDPKGGPVFYGFPALDGPGGGVKVAIHHGGVACTPETVDRAVGPAEASAMRACLRDRLPDLDGRLLDAKTCFYTNTPDQHFVIGRHPGCPQVMVAAGFSGHGFKFAPVVGEILADLALDGSTRHPIGLFSPNRRS